MTTDKRAAAGRARAKAWYHANKARKQAYDRTYRKAHKLKRQESSRKWARANYDKQLAWRQANPEKYRLRKLAWDRKHPERRRAACLKRRALQLGATVDDPRQIVEFVWAVRSSLETQCFYCGTPLFGKIIHLDHIVPLSRGGKHAVSNLCASCPSCNLRKSNKTPEEWRPVQPVPNLL